MYIKNYIDFLNEDLNVKRAVAVYNADKQKLIGIFSSQILASKYIYGKYNNDLVSNSLKNSSTILKSILNHRVAVRYAKKDQIELLGDEKYIMLDEDSPKPKSNMLIDKTVPSGDPYAKHNNTDAAKAYQQNRRINRIDREELDSINPVKLL